MTTGLIQNGDGFIIVLLFTPVALIFEFTRLMGTFLIVIQKFGYMAILVRAFLEGETILIIGGFTAHQGYMMLPDVILAAFVGTLFSDQLFFSLDDSKDGSF